MQYIVCFVRVENFAYHQEFDACKRARSTSTLHVYLVLFYRFEKYVCMYIRYLVGVCWSLVPYHFKRMLNEYDTCLFSLMCSQLKAHTLITDTHT